MIVEDSGSSAIVNEPDEGVPYGIDFSRLIEFKATPEDFDRNMKTQGIWTYDDVRANPNGVRNAIRDVYGVDLVAVLNAVRKLENDGGTT